MRGSLQGPGAPPENSLAAASHSRHALGPHAAWVGVSSLRRSGPESPLSSHSQPLHPWDRVWGPVLPKRVTARVYLGAGSHGQHHPETPRSLRGCSPRPDARNVQRGDCGQLTLTRTTDRHPPHQGPSRQPGPAAHGCPGQTDEDWPAGPGAGHKAPRTQRLRSGWEA